MACKSIHCRAKKAVGMTMQQRFFTGGNAHSHDTTGLRIGWRVTPAVNLGGDDRKGLRAQSSGVTAEGGAGVSARGLH
jgi:hypothetical protein